MSTRASREQVLMLVAKVFAMRATCQRKRNGCVIAREGRIISTGYNGAPSGLPHCLDKGCWIENGHCIRTLHAEAAAISYAAREGISLLGSDLYCTTAPCFNCAKLIINAGIKKVFYRDEYANLNGLTELHSSGITVQQLRGESNEAEFLLGFLTQSELQPVQSGKNQ